MLPFAPEACYRIFQTRDARFDGKLFVGVRSTGIYCRPVCPARSPHFKNCEFFVSAAAAQEAGFRPCLRCRPETAPDTACWGGTWSTVSRAMTLIGEGALDGDGTVDALASRLGVGERQLRRLFDKHLGASPVAVAQTRRILFAKQLLHQTRMPLAEIAFASGFGSVRRFNETFRALFQRPPGMLRRKGQESDGQAPIVLLLRYRPPYDWSSMLRYLAARAVDGVECVEGGSYRRTMRLGTAQVEHDAARQSLRATIRLEPDRSPNLRELPKLVGQLRRLFDLGADTAAIEAHLASDPLLAEVVGRQPGLRTPGAWDAFELAVRAVLGQQVSVEAGRKLAAKLVGLCDVQSALATPGLTHLFPTPAEVAGADLGALGMPQSRRDTLRELAARVAGDPALLSGHASVEAAMTALRQVPGIGPWTAEYIAIRALREPDAFPASDVALLRSAGRLLGGRPSVAELMERAEQWRPWRAYAAQHLWTDLATSAMGDVAA